MVWLADGFTCRIDAVFDESSTKEDEECVICMDRKAAVILPCAHAYCEQCIDTWLVIWHIVHGTMQAPRAAQMGQIHSWRDDVKDVKTEL